MKIIKQCFAKGSKNCLGTYSKIFIECIKYTTQLALSLHCCVFWHVATYIVLWLAFSKWNKNLELCTCSNHCWALYFLHNDPTFSSSSPGVRAGKNSGKTTSGTYSSESLTLANQNKVLGTIERLPTWGHW